MQNIRKIAIFTGTRAEYGLLYPLIRELSVHEEFKPRVYVSGAHLDPEFGNTLSEIENDGVEIGATIAIPNLGENMTVDCGQLVKELGLLFQQPEHQADFFIVLGDRYETLAAAMSAFLLNIALVHVQGGDVVRGGMLDDSIRHAVTKLAHLHFPASEASAKRILSLGEEPWRVVTAGSLVIDNIRMMPTLEKQYFVEALNLDPEKPWVIFTQHPINTMPQKAGEQALETLEALASLGDKIQVVATYPNQDHGGKAIIDCLETYAVALPQFRVIKSLGRVRYLNFLRHATLMIGNSSSGLLETAHFRLPCINVGERQKGRECGQNVIHVKQDKSEIIAALNKVLYDSPFREQLRQGQHPFGSGQAAKIIADTLSQVPLGYHLLQKQITY